MPGSRIEFTLSHCPFAPRYSKVRVKGFFQLSGGNFAVVVISTRAAQAGVTRKGLSGVLALLLVLVGGVSGAASSWQVSVGGASSVKYLQGFFSGVLAFNI